MLLEIIKKWDKFESKITKKFTKNQKKMWQILIFLIRFSLLAIPLHLLIWANIDALFLQKITAITVEKVLSLLTTDFSREGILFFVQTKTGLLTAEISKDCVGWKSILSLVGLIFAVRGVKLQKRLTGVLIGLILVFIGNITRLTTTFYLTSVKGLYFFSIIHNFLWQWGLTLLIICIWAIWLESANAKYLYS